MKKHRSARNKVEPNRHDTAWSRLVCSVCHVTANFGSETFIEEHARCEPQTSTNKGSFISWLNELSLPKPQEKPQEKPQPEKFQPCNVRQLREDLRLSSDEDEDEFDAPKKREKGAAPVRVNVPTPSAPINVPAPSHLKDREVDLDLEGVFSAEENEWEEVPKKRQCLDSETEKAVATILPPLPPPPTLAPTHASPIPASSDRTPPLPSTAVTTFPEPTPSAANKEPVPSATSPPTATLTPPTPKPRSRGIKKQSNLHNKDAYMARVSQREAHVALLDRYNNARTVIKRLNNEKEAAELQASSIKIIKEENVRLRTQRGKDVEEISKLAAENSTLHSRLDFTNNVNRELEEKIRKLKAENEQLKKTAGARPEGHTLHIPCVNGVIPMRPEINDSGAPLSICYDDERAGVICHHIALNRVAGKLSATALTVQKRPIPDELIQSAKRSSI